MIGIITFHNINNLGAVLQASALQNYLSNYVDDCELINYIPNNYCPHNRFSFLRMTAHTGKYILTSRHWSADLRRERSFRSYRSKYMKLSNHCYYGDKDIFTDPPQYNILVSGSDQIFNTTLTGDSEAYYLGFAHGVKKISYASSFGRTEISENEKRLIRSELDQFDHISVREESGRQIVEKYTHHVPQIVVDPVFLLDRSVWEQRCSECLTGKYIFVYSMENSPALETIVNELKRISGLPVYVVRGGGTTGRITGEEVFSCGPSEFLGYIKNAEYLITNSYHGTAFGYIFGKKTLSIAHSTRNTRLENLLSLTNVYNKQYQTVEDIISVEDRIIDGEKAFSFMTRIISDSKTYLEKALSNNLKNEGQL